MNSQLLPTASLDHALNLGVAKDNVLYMLVPQTPNPNTLISTIIVNFLDILLVSLLREEQVIDSKELPLYSRLLEHTIITSVLD
jgi:hypothetical protein